MTFTRVKNMKSLFEQASQVWEEGKTKKAFELFRKAAKQGDKGALLNLGYCYDEGVGTRKNIRKAMCWYEKAAKTGELAAYTNIAIYHCSIGDFERAKQWFLDALEKGDKETALELAKLGLEGKINLSRTEITEYLQIVINAKARIEVCEAVQEEAYFLLEQCNKPS